MGNTKLWHLSPCLPGHEHDWFVFADSRDGSCGTHCHNCGLDMMFTMGTDRRGRPVLTVQQISERDRGRQRAKSHQKMMDKLQRIRARRAHGLSDEPRIGVGEEQVR